MRGLGYWFFYGRDALGAWIQPAVRMAQSIPALVLSFTIPGLAIAAGFLTRFRNRGYFAVLLAVGLLAGVGAHPWDAPSPAGAIFKAWTRTDSGLAFRSTPRAVPLIALAVAIMLAAAVAAVASRYHRTRPRLHSAVAGTLLVMIMVNQWALFTGEFVDRNLQRPEELPSYWTDAAAAMDSGGQDTRAYEMPGSDFASYRWGNTVDPITPGLIDRPYASRELIPYGTPSSADMLNAWDLPLQEGRFDPGTVAPVAQLLGVGTIVHRGDLQYERFRTPRPDITYHQLLRTPGLSAPVIFGDGTSNDTTPALRLDDELALGPGANLSPAPAISLFDLEDPRDPTRAVSGSSPTLLAGDAAGIVAWAGTGALDPDRPILYSASFAGDPESLEEQLEIPAAQLVVTDTNRRQARRWGSVRENDGYTERAGEEPLEVDPADNRLEKFPDATDESFTVSEQAGDATVSASAYGNPVSYTPADRAAKAFDGDPLTAWRVGAFDEPRGEYLQIGLDEPVTTDAIFLQQSQRQGNRWITEVEISIDDGEPMTVRLDDSSRGVAPGQRVSFDERTFSHIRITITETNLPRMDRYTGVSDVGLAEVAIPGVEPVTELIRPPTDLLDAAGGDSLTHPLTWVFTRRAANPSEVVVSDEESVMRRVVENPAARRYTTYGAVRASTLSADGSVDDLLGVQGVRATADVRMPGDLRSRATSAVDGDPATAWQTPINSPTGHTLTVTNPEPFDVDGLDLTLRRDGLHSIPTVVTVAVNDGAPQRIELPPIDTGERSQRGGTETVTLPYRANGVQELRLTIEEVREANSIDWFGGSTTVLPVGIAELNLPVQAQIPGPGSAIDDACRDDLVTVDSSVVPVRIHGTVGDVLDGSLMEFEGCDPAALPEGKSLVETSPGAVTGFDVDRLVFASAPGGEPGRNTLEDGPAPVSEPPSNSVSRPGTLTWDMSVSGADEPYWVVLGQSQSPGFTATASGTDDAEPVDLGQSVVINGYANGWLVNPDQVGPDATITIEFAPQRMVWIALLLSALGVLVCLVLLLWPLEFLAGSPSVNAPADLSVTAVRPFAVEAQQVDPVRALVWAAIAGVSTFIVAGWAVGLGIGLVTLGALALRRGRVMLRVLGTMLFAAAAGFVVAKQLRGNYLVDFNWMNLFEVTHAWTLAAVALLVLDPVIGRIRSTASGTPRTEPGSDP
jgi:arabinofuranan 3-O-arabinosyltransferase